MLDLSRLTCLGEALRDAVLTFKTNVALIEADRKKEKARFTYQQVHRAAERYASGLQAQGFEAGDRHAILMSNQSRWVLGGTGALWSGAVLVPLDYKLTAKEQAALLRHCAPKVLLTEWGTWRTLKDEDLPASTRVIVSEAPQREDLAGAERFEHVEGPSYTYRARLREDTACIVYSSGTGGQPKGCMLTHGNYLAQASVLGTMYPLEECDRYFSVLPTNHAIDFMCGFIVPLQFGAAVVHQRTLRPQFLGPTMKRYDVTHMALVPMLLKKFEEKIREKLDELPAWQRSVVDGLMVVNEAATRKKPNHGLSSKLLKPIHAEFGRLKLMFCGGAFVDRETAEFFYKLGLPVAIGYGLTEACTVLTVNDLEPFRGDTVGTPVTGVEIEIRNENDEGVGEVWAKGPTVMKGYLDEPALTAESIVDGWLRTGDLGLVDASGHLKLLGRTKNMIVTEGGKNVYPEDIEAAFDGLDGAEEICVFAANYVWPASTMVGEQLMLVVRAEADADMDELLGAIARKNRRLADFKRLSGYVLWDEEFPRTASMKLKRLVLKQQLEKGPSRDEALVSF
ncbi:MAG: long-chain acyl-CoA synthetase [Myxococcota bacterium]|jgi:long-chain acyl-CoA synthetase